MTAPELPERIRERARELGFARAGFASAEPLEPEGERLRAWVREGRHGAMHWMADTAEVRADPGHRGMLPGARSVIALAMPYARRLEASVGPDPGRVARYAHGRDYHNVLHRRARKLAAMLREEGHAARVSVDSMPVLERAWAQRAGIGFIGKNCCLIVPGLGSYVFLGCVVTTAALPPDEPMKERCGSCRACLDACPTDAFVGPRSMDARRCISYQTIENRGHVPYELRPGIGDWMFGCDVCQDVCPFNRTSPPQPEHTEAFAPDARWQMHDAADVLCMEEATFAHWAHGSPIKRTGRAGMARNAAVVLGNAGSRRHLPVLEHAARTHPSGVVRETAAWAARRCAARGGDHDDES